MATAALVAPTPRISPTLSPANVQQRREPAFAEHEDRSIAIERTAGVLPRIPCGHDAEPIVHAVEDLEDVIRAACHDAIGASRAHETHGVDDGAEAGASFWLIVMFGPRS